jgi:hypothetical protein
MEEILVFLNNLGDDWRCFRRGRVENISGALTFMCKFQHMWFEDCEVQFAGSCVTSMNLKGIRNPQNLRFLRAGPLIYPRSGCRDRE